MPAVIPESLILPQLDIPARTTSYTTLAYQPLGLGNFRLTSFLALALSSSHSLYLQDADSQGGSQDGIHKHDGAQKHAGAVI